MGSFFFWFFVSIVVYFLLAAWSMGVWEGLLVTLLDILVIAVVVSLYEVKEL